MGVPDRCRCFQIHEHILEPPTCGAFLAHGRCLVYKYSTCVFEMMCSLHTVLNSLCWHLCRRPGLVGPGGRGLSAEPSPPGWHSPCRDGCLHTPTAAQRRCSGPATARVPGRRGSTTWRAGEQSGQRSLLRHSTGVLAVWELA